MPDEEVALETPTETPSGEAVEDMKGTPPTEVDDLDAVEVPGADGEEPPGGEDEESDSWKSLAAKYPNKTGAELREIVGNQYWEAKNYASGKARENEELRAMLKEQGEGPEDPDAEPQPHPQVEALDKRIQGLYDKDQSTQKQQNDSLVKLAEADKTIAKLEARMEDAQERGKDSSLEDFARERATNSAQTFAARVEAAQAKRQSILDRYGSLGDKRETYGNEMEKLLTDKDWLTKVADKQAHDQKSAKADAAKFNAEFPQYVDSLIEKTADRLEAPQEQRLRKSLWIHVNRAMMVELQGRGPADLDDLDVPEMVDGYVEEYLKDRDLVSRTRFERKSAEKRKVSGKATAAASVPAAKKAPVPPSLMSTGDVSPGMLRARKYLGGKGL